MSQTTTTKRVPLSKPLQLSIFQRDGWLCRWCSKPVIFGPVMKYIEMEVRRNGHAGPLAYYHPHWTRATAPLLDELGAVLDHVKAFSAGGPCDPDNLATACAKCNGRKSSAPLDKWGGRAIRKPIKGKYGDPSDWDGLSSLFVLLAERNLPELNVSERDWLKAFKPSLIDSVPKICARFRRWQGPEVLDTYGGKVVLDYGGEPVFAELAILRSLQKEGFEGVWVDTYGKRFRRSLSEDCELTENAQSVFDLIVSANGGTQSGCWDVFAWKDGTYHFVESKQVSKAYKDRIKNSQVRWLEASVKSGLDISSFKICEWDVEEASH